MGLIEDKLKEIDDQWGGLDSVTDDDLSSCLVWILAIAATFAVVAVVYVATK